MRCKVLAFSLGYNGHIYRKGEYVDVVSSEEVERLSGYGVIIANPLPVAAEGDVEPKEVKKTAGTSVVKSKKGSGKK